GVPDGVSRQSAQLPAPEPRVPRARPDALPPLVVVLVLDEQRAVLPLGSPVAATFDPPRDPDRPGECAGDGVHGGVREIGQPAEDRKSTRLNSSHVSISYAVFCLKKKNKEKPVNGKKYVNRT